MWTLFGFAGVGSAAKEEMLAHCLALPACPQFVREYPDRAFPRRVDLWI
jgi:hypothetical protein